MGISSLSGGSRQRIVSVRDFKVRKLLQMNLVKLYPILLSTAVRLDSLVLTKHLKMLRAQCVLGSKDGDAILI